MAMNLFYVLADRFYASPVSLFFSWKVLYIYAWYVELLMSLYTI